MNQQKKKPKKQSRAAKELWKFIKSQEYKKKLCWTEKDSFADIDHPSKDDRKLRLNLSLLIVFYFVHEYMHRKLLLFPGSKESKEKNDRREKIIEKKTDDFVDKMSKEEIQEIAEYILKKFKTK